MKKLLLCLFFGLLFSCDLKQNKSKQIKKHTTLEWSTKEVLGDRVKDTLISRSVYAYYADGSLMYSIFSKDSSCYKQGEAKTTIKKEGNKKYFYNAKGKLKQIDVLKGDTIFTYNAQDFEKYIYFAVKDEQGLLSLGTDSSLYTLYKDRKFDKEKNLLYTLKVGAYKTKSGYSYPNIITIEESTYEYY